MNQSAMRQAADGGAQRPDLLAAESGAGSPVCAHWSQAAQEAAEGHVRFVVAARRLRDAIIGADLFADPAWDMLLELYAASLAQHRLSTTELIASSGVPPTTGLRWIDKLESVGIVRRREDRLDRRRMWVEISDHGAMKMRSLFEMVGSAQAPI